MGAKCRQRHPLIRRLNKMVEVNADQEERVLQRPVIASLAAFIGAGLRPTTPLARAIVVVLAAKLIAVAAMMVFQHFGGLKTAVDAAAISRLLGP